MHTTNNATSEQPPHWRRTKIIATLGPASSSPDILKKIIHAGADAVRINMSHGNHDGHKRLIAMVRKEAARVNQHIAIIMDLCGPKIRTGRFKHGHIELRQRQKVIISCRNIAGDDGIIPSQYLHLYKDVKVGNRVLLDDGNMELRVRSVEGKDIHCSVTHGGHLSDHKGMNLPDTVLTVPAFTNKDREDALLGIREQVDFIALSFVRNARDVTNLVRFIRKNGGDIPIISKIEKPEAIDNIDEILEHSYGIMIARGDLGIELPAKTVPLIQTELINLARLHNKPVIVATQMLESMIQHSRPTRAEVGDIANATLSSTDAVMLSAETAAGKHPVLAVKTMDEVIREIETYQWKKGSFAQRNEDDICTDKLLIREAVSHAALSLANELHLQSIVIPTHSGATARILSADRPMAPCMGVCQDAVICRRLTLHWGVVPIHIESGDTNDWKQLCTTISRRFKCTGKGRTVLVVSGFNDDPKKNEPVLKLITM